MKNFRFWHSTHGLFDAEIKFIQLTEFFFSIFFLPGILGPSHCLTILLTVDIEDPVASDVHLNKKF